MARSSSVASLCSRIARSSSPAMMQAAVARGIRGLEAEDDDGRALGERRPQPAKVSALTSGVSRDRRRRHRHPVSRQRSRALRTACAVPRRSPLYEDLDPGQRGARPPPPPRRRSGPDDDGDSAMHRRPSRPRARGRAWTGWRPRAGPSAGPSASACPRRPPERWQDRFAKDVEARRIWIVIRYRVQR